MDPYIGITDFMSGDEALLMQAVFNRHKRPGTRRRLMVGVMMSRKTLYGIPTPWEQAFPRKEDIAGIFCSDEAYNCLHYADYGYDLELRASLTRALSYGGLGINALQLDMIWPEPGPVAAAVHASRKQLEVILQISSQAFDDVHNNPRELVRRLEDYESVIHGVLLDKSMGRGVGMNEEFLRPFVEELYNHAPHLGVGVGGGLGPNSLHLLGSLPEYFPSISADAQSQIRPSGSAKDPVDWDMGADYLRKALAILP